MIIIIIIIDHSNYIWLYFTNSSIDEWSGCHRNSITVAPCNCYCSYEQTLQQGSTWLSKSGNTVSSINELQIILTVSMSTGKPLFDASISGSKPLASRKYSLAWFISPLRFACNAASLNSFWRATRNANCFSWRDCGALRTTQQRKQNVTSVQCLLMGHVIHTLS